MVSARCVLVTGTQDCPDRGRALRAVSVRHTGWRMVEGLKGPLSPNISDR